MSYARITYYYERYGDAYLLAKANFIYTQVSTNTMLFPAPTPTMPGLLASIKAFDAGKAASKTGRHVSREERRLLRSALITKLRRLSVYVRGVADGDPLVILQSGFDLAKRKEWIDISTPQTPEARYTGQPGELLLKTRAVKGAYTYEWQYTTDPEMKSWEKYTTSTASRVIKGLTPGKIYYFRVMVRGARSQVKYSDWITKLVF